MAKEKSTELHYETVTPLLRKNLNDIMENQIFESFYLVGGTSLSLRLGHRGSVDIDLFTNAPYGSLDFSVFEKFFQKNYRMGVLLHISKYNPERFSGGRSMFGVLIGFFPSFLIFPQFLY